MTSTPTPMRKRGVERRQQIVEATLRLVARDGAASVTHRAIAQEADVPLAATTYYFASKSDLLLAAFRLHSEREAERIERALGQISETADTPIKLANRLGDWVVEGLTTHREQLLAEYELLVESARTPDLEQLSRALLDRLERLVADALAAAGSPRPDVDARLVLAAMAGLEVDRLATLPEHLDTREIRVSLRRLMTALVGGDHEEGAP